MRGNVTGDLITGGETINVEGTIGGNVIGGGRGVSLLRARVGRNLYGFGRDVRVDAAAEVAGNALAFGDKIDINGRVGTDVKGFGANVTVSGAVEGELSRASRASSRCCRRHASAATSRRTSTATMTSRSLRAPSSAARLTRSSSTASSAATAI